ncbi:MULTISPECIES: ornithine carbamoyltransferase [unclassified Fusibacter]|uniref:ornithine carbamoyltransferase n=1 Tax=unclassified Fusibacter TaxID=2624464 RepID=UPI001012E59F|nr:MULTISPECIES: ornithine carbamoyltransferase [unclassified Fusibacter]MCK8060388.1 ornithine carbamoyltransferase [Fusibacter sp. A2]NPE20323.1 ornithine carbamoyltransferase [Fusibacter sp. A1]RXV63529.1 ornithine carbamoyltransferase [Fusibacter sp. A1]
MYGTLKGKHFITLRDWTNDQIDMALETASDLKRRHYMDIKTPILEYKTIALMFFEASTRTRNSMEMGIAQLGGHANYLDTSTMQISHGEVAKDTGVILSSFGHGLACRYCDWEIGNKYITEMAKYASRPVMNLQCDLYHPMQGLADLMTIKEKHESTKGLNVSIIWAFATSHKKPISVPLTQALLFPRYGMNVTLAHPPGFELPDWVIEEAKENASKHGGSFRVIGNIEEAFKDADIVIPKNWGSWSGKGPEPRLEDHKHWKCTEKLMDTAHPNVHYMHALPADRGNEVEDSVIDGQHSIVYQEAENRLHTAKAVMALTL